MGKKRLTKAIERTANWFQLLSQGINADGADPENKPFLFGVAQYDRTYPVQLPLLVKHMTSNGAGGIVIGNSHLGESAEVRTETVMAIKALLSAEIPTMIQGADSLQEVCLRWIQNAPITVVRARHHCWRLFSLIHFEIFSYC